MKNNTANTVNSEVKLQSTMGEKGEFIETQMGVCTHIRTKKGQGLSQK